MQHNEKGVDQDCCFRIIPAGNDWCTEQSIHIPCRLKDASYSNPISPSDTSALWKASDLAGKSSVQYQLLYWYEGDEAWEKEMAELSQAGE